MIPPCEWPTRATGSPGSMPASRHRGQDALGVRRAGAADRGEVGRQVADVVVAARRGREHVVGAGQVDDVARPVGPADRLHLDGAVVGGVRVAGEQADLGAGGSAAPRGTTGTPGRPGRAARGRLGARPAARPSSG